MFTRTRPFAVLIISAIFSLQTGCSSKETGTEEILQPAGEEAPAEAPADASLEKSDTDPEQDKALADDSSDVTDPNQFQLQGDTGSPAESPDSKEPEAPAMADSSASYDSSLDSEPAAASNSSVYFAKASARITSTDRQQLKEIASKLKADRSLKVALTGHCDNRGSKSYNKRLAIKRAKAVRTALLKMGVKSQQISLGKPQLAERGNSEEQHAQNRRVEISFL